MARYIATSGSNFNPLGYDDIMKPIQALQQQHDAAADAYDTLNLETEAIRQYITDNPGDSRALQIYNNYSQKLNALQNNLWNKGVTAQTRRDLSDARAAFGEMGKVKTAIENRQARSKEYWDARHKNPDLVAGFDPGMAGLNEYLANDLYGQDWYHYSGNQFTNEVGTDAKARVDELLREVNTKSSIPGYITRTVQEGATSQEVAKAANAVRRAMNGDNEAIASLKPDSVEGILANVLMSHIESTGASNAGLDRDEFNRLVEYGISGLSQAIGETKMTDLQDKVWNIQQEEAAAEREYQRKKDYKLWEMGLTTPSGSPKNTGQTIPMQSAGYEDWVKSTKNEDSYYRDAAGNPIQVQYKLQDGSTAFATSSYDLADKIYNTSHRQDIRKRYGGFDILAPDKEIKLRTKDGRELTFKTGKLTDSEAKELGLDARDAIAIRTPEGVLQNALTLDVSNALTQTNRHIRSITSINDGIERKAISPKKQRELREKYEYPAQADWNDFQSYMGAYQVRGDYSPGILVTSDSSHDYVRNNLGNSMITNWNNVVDRKTGKAAKDSRFLIYEVDEGNMGPSKTSYNDLAEVFGTNNAGEIENTLRAIAITPEDLINNDRPMIRFQSSFKPGKVFMVDAALLGSTVEPIIDEAAKATDSILGPILHPGEAMRMSDEEQIYWANAVAETLKDADVQFPMVTNPNGTKRPVTPIEAMRDPEYRMRIREAARTGMLDVYLARIREVLGLEHEQVKGDTSADAERYF